MVGRNSVKSAERVLQILEYLRESARLSDVANRLNHPISSASALNCMVDLGYMQFDEAARHYMPAARSPSTGDGCAWAFSTVGGQARSHRRGVLFIDENAGKHHSRY